MKLQFIKTILESLKENEKLKLGVLDLSKKLDIAPKNLLNNIKEMNEKGLLVKSTIPLKTKGRKRVYYLSNKGKKLLEDLK